MLAGYALERVAAGQSMPGVFAVHDNEPIGAVIEDLLLLVECSRDDKWAGQVRFLAL